MPNMSYCRFQNTLDDLQDCYDNMDEDLDAYEADAREKLIKLCVAIAQDYGDEVESHDPCAEIVGELADDLEAYSQG